MIGKFFKKLLGSNEAPAAPAQLSNSVASAHKPETNRSPRHSGSADRNSSARDPKATPRDQSSSARDHTSSPGDHTSSPRDHTSSPRDHKKARPKSDRPAQTTYRPARKPAPVIHAPWDPASFVVEDIAGKTRFQDLGLQPEIMHAVADLGFSYCSPIQAQSLPHSLQGKDVVGKAQTGTGKTAAFLATIIDDLLKNPIPEKRYDGLSGNRVT